MTGRALSALLLLLAGLSLAEALSCAPCEKASCLPPDCPGRIVRDVCGCCDVCARGLGDRCGGHFDSLGLCDDGLVCQTSPEHGQLVVTAAEGVCIENVTVCEHELCQLIFGTCICTEPEGCKLPDVSADPTVFTSRQECEQAAKGNQLPPVVPPTQPAEGPSCPGVRCDPGVTACPSDSVLKAVPSEQPECCGPVGVCLCDLESCPPAPSCPEGQEVHLLTKGQHKPGSCCTTWECKATVPPASLSCTHDGRQYAAGEQWQSNLCTSCQCKNGLAFCQSTECPPVAHCAKTTHDPDQCCPRCVDGCLSPSGQHHNVSEQWLEDDCTTCSCEADGQPRCVSEMCRVSCRSPRHVPGQCCPVCDGARQECDVMCQHGYRTSRDGSTLCECLTAEEVQHAAQGCRSMATCKKACPHGFKVDEAGCERCKCKKCRKLKDCNKSCPFGFETNDRACAICRCRAAPAGDGEGTSDGTPATELYCVTQDGGQYEEGEQWHDGCRQCYCHGGLEMCALISCPAPRCHRPQIAPGQCCPTCPDGLEHPAPLNVTVCQSVDGQTYVEGQTWQLDPCTRCLCHVGRVLCSSPPCPPTPCAEPTRPTGGCCGNCSTETSRQVAGGQCTDAVGGQRRAGETWRPDPCVSCSCRDGEVSCFHEKCPLVDCARPVLNKGHCCPVCLEPPVSSHCFLNNVTRPDGDTWHLDPCTSCICQQGIIACTVKTCSVQCDAPVAAEPGHCCPVCKEESGTKPSHHLMSGVSKATHRTVVRTPEGGAQTPHRGVERQPGDQQSSPNYIVLCAVIGLLVLLLLAVLVFWCVRRQRSQYSPKHVTEEKKPLNDPQIMHFMSLNSRGVHQDTLILEKTGAAVKDV